MSVAMSTSDYDVTPDASLHGSSLHRYISMVPYGQSGGEWSEKRLTSV